MKRARRHPRNGGEKRMRRYFLPAIVAALVLSLAVVVCAGGWLGFGQEHHTKVLLFGLDAGDWDVLNRLFEEKRCPVLRKLVRDGSSGYLETFYKDSPVIWTAIATGCPDKVHGIGGYKATSWSRKVKALWNVAADYGRRCIFIGWWATYPAEEIEGVIVSDQALAGNLTKGKENIIYPPSRVAEFKEVMLGEAEPVTNTLEDGRVKFRQRWDMAFANVADHLVGEKWDLFSLYLRMVDISSHSLTDKMYRKKGQPPFERILDDGEKEKEYWRTVDDHYERCDEILGALLEKSGPDTITIVVSDHGFLYDGRDHGVFPVPRGIIIAAGPGIRKGNKIEGATIFDVMPTVMATMDLPVSRELTGKPLLEIFKRPPGVKYVESYGLPEGGQKKGEGELDEDFVKELKALGYIQ